MPIYEFRCNRCDHCFSKLYRHMHSSDEAMTPPCPACQCTDTTRMVSSFAVQGPSRPDAQEATAQKSHGERIASITPKSQIESWRGGKN